MGRFLNRWFVEEPVDLDKLRLEAEQGTPRMRCLDGRDRPDAAVHGGRADADAAEYGALGGDRAAATAPASLRLLVTW